MSSWDLVLRRSFRMLFSEIENAAMSMLEFCLILEIVNEIQLVVSATDR